jgi:hypothetical protein
MPAMAGLLKRCWRRLRNEPSTYGTGIERSKPSSLGTELTEIGEWKGKNEWPEQQVSPGLNSESETELVGEGDGSSLRGSRSVGKV